MNGAEILIRTAVESGVKLCFANAGTTELPVVAALDRVAGIRPVLGLFEGVCTGAADGYGRMASRPAMALLHLGPGLANGIANLHNARRARSPVLCVIGEHATWHRQNDPPLAMDIEALARTVSPWVRTSASPGALSHDMAEAVRATLPGRVSVLIAPSDLQQAEADDGAIAGTPFVFDPVDGEVIEKAARLLRGGTRTALILGGRALRAEGLAEAARVRAATGCDLLTDAFPACMERGGPMPAVRRIPYFPEPALDLLKPYGAVVLAGAHEPVTFFAYPGLPGRLLGEGQARVPLSTGGQDEVAALRALADALDGPPAKDSGKDLSPGPHRPGLPSGCLTPEKVCLTLAALQPEGAIIVDEGLTTAFDYYGLSAGAPRHSYLTIAGGAIGYGMPCALGAALACPDRTVIDLQADGSALYTVQALWTEAREALDITTLICSNRSYRILEMELSRSGADAPGPAARTLTSLASPAIDWVGIGRAFGVASAAVDTVEGLAREMGRASAENGPHLIEMRL